MASVHAPEMQMQHEGAAAAVAALYFCCLAGTAFNIRLTGFKLYIPLSIANALRAISFATRAAFYSTGNINIFLVSRATQAIGLGISIAMCSCFLIVWLRNARPNRQPRALPPVMTVVCKLLVACVIAMGPILGIAGAAVMGAGPTNPELLAHGLELRKASTTGFLIVISLLTLCTALVAFNWVRRAAAASKHMPQQQQQVEMAQAHTTKQQQQQQQQQQEEGGAWQGGGAQEWQDSTATPSWQQQLRGDGLILLLLACDALLAWSAAALVASVLHPALTSSLSVEYPVMVLPELLVAFVWAMPTLAARVALGARYNEWRQQQALPRQAASSPSASNSESADPEAAVADVSVGELVKASAA